MKKNLQEQISKIKKVISETEKSRSGSIFGGASVKLPRPGAHAGQTGWQSANAWDIKATIGTPVHAVAAGTLITFSDYGEKPKKVGKKTLFGVSFTVNSDNGLPDVYYTHLKNVTVKKGDHIECGQLLGYVMDFPGSDYDHLHIGVEYGHDIKEFLTDDGKLKCGGESGLNLSSGEKSQLDDLFKILDSEFDGDKVGDLLGVFDENTPIPKKGLFDTMKELASFWGLFKK